METSTVTTKGQVLIPSKFRKKFGIKAKNIVAFVELNGELVIRPLDKAYFERFAGILSGKGDVLKALMDEKKLEREL